jgi:hypothetical protein
MKGRKWKGREGRRDWRDIREEKGEEVGGKWLGEGCAHRFGGIDAHVRCHSKYTQQLFGTELIR